MNVLMLNWWAIALRGLAGIVFGILAFLAPGASIAALVFLFGAYAFVDGVFNILAAVRDGDGERSWLSLLVQGIVGLAAGAATFVVPAATALVLLFVVAAWAIATGILEIAAAMRLRREITGEWLLATSGALSILLGVLVLVAPAIGVMAVVSSIGAYAIASGVTLVVLGFRLRTTPRPQPQELQRAA